MDLVLLEGRKLNLVDDRKFFKLLQFKVYTQLRMLTSAQQWIVKWLYELCTAVISH